MAVVNVQDIGHPSDHDYEAGSPHLRHRSIRDAIIESIRVDVLRRAGRRPVRVLEVGAGHGSFTDHIVALGAQVTVTEMSRASADVLRRRYRYNDDVRVLLDRAGDQRELGGETFDLVVCVSVLHHIPDYLQAVDSLARRVETGGAFLSFQDPLWYPRRPRSARLVSRAAFYSWRLTQGDLVEGANSLHRRIRNAMDEQNPRDSVEYHVLRQGCDEQAIAARLAPLFEHVEVRPYWSTPSAAWQRLGERRSWQSDFGIIADTRRCP